jgi:DNA-binding NtrC family response regulator
MRTLEQIKRDAVLERLAYHHGNATATAKSLGVSVRAVSMWLRKYGVARKAKRAPEQPGRPTVEQMRRRIFGEAA